MTTQIIIVLVLIAAWIFMIWAVGRLFNIRWRALFFIAAVILLPAAARAECLPSAAKVWAKHEDSHATWRLIDGHKCWMVGNPHAYKQSPAGKDAGNDNGNARPQPHGQWSNGTATSEGSDKTVSKTVRAGASPAATPLVTSPLY